jgi:hypothetical protein
MVYCNKENNQFLFWIPAFAGMTAWGLDSKRALEWRAWAASQLKGRFQGKDSKACEFGKVEGVLAVHRDLAKLA